MPHRTRFPEHTNGVKSSQRKGTHNSCPQTVSPWPRPLLYPSPTHVILVKEPKCIQTVVCIGSAFLPVLSVWQPRVGDVDDSSSTETLWSASSHLIRTKLLFSLYLTDLSQNSKMLTLPFPFRVKMANIHSMFPMFRHWLIVVQASFMRFLFYLFYLFAYFHFTWIWCSYDFQPIPLTPSTCSVPLFHPYRSSNHSE